MRGFVFWKSCAKASGTFIGLFMVPILFNLFLVWTLRDQLDTSKRLQVQIGTQSKEWRAAVEILSHHVAKINEALATQQEAMGNNTRTVKTLMESAHAFERSLSDDLSMMLLASDDSAQARYEVLRRLQTLEARPQP